MHRTCVELLVDGGWTPAADVLGGAPTFVMVRAPFTCSAPTRARVRRAILGGGEVTSNPARWDSAQVLTRAGA
ncbi:MAG TPA: hypothetical protein VL049_00305 [Candidatus Dormibacteraeota bacterium]|nr:hypothetical protein [Candidatus Dormibacteraeota bacterium]